jgi:hypothetical protein
VPPTCRMSKNVRSSQLSRKNCANDKSEQQTGPNTRSSQHGMINAILDFKQEMSEKKTIENRFGVLLVLFSPLKFSLSQQIPLFPTIQQLVLGTSAAKASTTGTSCSAALRPPERGSDSGTRNSTSTGSCMLRVAQSWKCPVSRVGHPKCANWHNIQLDPRSFQL